MAHGREHTVGSSTPSGAHPGTRRPSPGETHRALRGPAVAIAVVLSLLGLGCAAPTPPPGNGIDIDFGPLTVPLPPIEIRAPATTIPFAVCNIAYRPPGVNIVGATLTIPKVRIDPAASVVSVPNVKVTIPRLRVPLSTLTLRCGPLALPVQVDLIIPSTVRVQAATLNLAARTITLTNPSFTVDGAGIGIPGLGNLVIPLPPILNVPLPTTAIAF